MIAFLISGGPLSLLLLLLNVSPRALEVGERLVGVGLLELLETVVCLPVQGCVVRQLFPLLLLVCNQLLKRRVPLPCLLLHAAEIGLTQLQLLLEKALARRLVGHQ
eukprot:scaffold14647_cov60-Phaeocystis_antarctica.AAC.12